MKLATQGAVVSVEGPKGKMSMALAKPIQLELKDKEVHLKRPTDSISHKSLQGTMYRLVANMVQGVSKGFQKQLVIEGVGFKAEVKGQSLGLALGFTHPVDVPIPQGITVKAAKPTELLIEGIDKQVVGQFAARVRSIFQAEPYKGKGIRYLGEVVRRKAGKAVTK